MKKLLLLLVLPLLVFNCSDDELTFAESFNPHVTSPNCDSSAELELVSDGNSCDIPLNGFICEIIEIENTQFIGDEAFEWSPDICSVEVNDRIAFRNQDVLTYLEVVDKAHYIADERILIACNDSYELSTYICQKNEVINISLLGDLLGPDTTQLELRTMTLDYQEQTAGAKRNILQFYQLRSPVRVVNFWLRHFVGLEYYDNNNQSYKETIILNGISYNDVIEYRQTINVHSQSDCKLYLQKGVGILGFNIDGQFWIRE